MPFLLPFLISGVSDVLILLLNKRRLQVEEGLLLSSTSEENYINDDDENEAVVHHMGYMASLATLRLLLLLFPLPYHSYTGTAIRFPSCYSLFYGCSLLVLLGHMLALSVMDPDSLAALLPTSGGGTGGTGASALSLVSSYLSRSCWWMLALSVLSVLAHIVMLIHVRSTAPSVNYYSYYSSNNTATATARTPYTYRRLMGGGGGGGGSKKQLLTYYASKQSASALLHHHSRNNSRELLAFGLANNNLNNEDDEPVIVNSKNITSPTSRKRPSPTSNNNNGTTTTTTAMTTITTTKNNNNSSIGNGNGGNDRTASSSSPSPLSPLRNLSSQYDDFVSEMQGRIHLLKQDWNKKLDDFTHRHLNTTSTSTRKQHQQQHHHHHNNPLLPLTPFRVLLQLFAYQDVIDSGKLDAVFDMDQGQSMTFFVPQLLSFLLHGAYYESAPNKLEAWILDKCRKHVQFAHRCYWFLRAWSLEQSGGENESNSSISLQQQNGREQQQQQHSRNNSLSSLTGGGVLNVGVGGGNSSSSTGNLQRQHENNNSIAASGTGTLKLLPEEQAAVEELLLNVVQCGEAPARIMHYGNPKDETTPTNSSSMKTKKRRGKKEKWQTKNLSPLETSQQAIAGAQVVPPLSPGVASTADNDEKNGFFWGDSRDDDDNASALAPELALTPEMEASLPMDPETGFPSPRHLETLTAPRRYGFLPLTRAGPPLGMPSRTSTSTDSFQATPRFLDALLAMADELFLVPREQRKEQLKTRLQSIEAELLPSNAIYLPLSSSPHHRVWRIVADESIALNTKERVPCIICLEVVESDQSGGRINESHQRGAEDLSGVARDLSGIPKLKQLGLELPKLSMPKPSRSFDRDDRLGDDPEQISTRQKSESHLPQSPKDSSTGIPLQFLLPYYTIGGMSEKDVVNHWRFTPRDPHRGDSILDKMTSSLPLDMNRMRERIEQLKGKQGTILHELLSLTVPEGSRNAVFPVGPDDALAGADEEQESEIASFLYNDVLEKGAMLPDLEAGLADTDEPENDGVRSRELSPERRPEANVSMGQWTSPTGPSSPSQRRKQLVQTEDILSNMRNRRNNSSDHLSTEYGSTYSYERRKRADESNRDEVRPPRGAESKAKEPFMELANGDGTKKPPMVVFRENWQAKEDRLRRKSAFGTHPGWRLLPILVKANDDLRQEQLASQLIYRMAFILARERIPVWLCPYEIIAITDRGGIVEAVPDTISLDSLKRNDPDFTDLRTFYHSYHGQSTDALADAKSNFVESLAAYSIVTFLLQIKDRHNGNILIDNKGHVVHIDFGFFFLSSPGKNTGFESAPFKLTKDFMDLMDGPESHWFKTFRELCVRSFLALRRNCMEIILLVEMLKSGNEDLGCFRGRPDDAIRGLRERFRLDLSDRACKEYVLSLVDESLENWRTNWYDRYQRYCVGVL